MLPTPRPYRDERDLARMLALLQRGRAAAIPSYYVHPGDLKWWLYYPPLGASFWDRIYLWDDPAGDSRLLGWALLDPRGETFDVYYQPELHASTLAAEMFAWAESAVLALARSENRQQTGMFWVVPADTFRCGWLESRGYRVSYESVELNRSLEAPIAPPALPGGFTVRPCLGLPEVESRARAQYMAFESEAPFDKYLERFACFMRSPVYDPQRDLVAAAPDGRIAAFAISWVDESSRVGLFEPVGAHPDFQRLGLGKAVMLESLRSLQASGMRQAILTTGMQNTPALNLYAAVGFQQVGVFRFYERDAA